MEATSLNIFSQYAHLNTVFISRQVPLVQELLTKECLKFLVTLHRMHNAQRLKLVQHDRVLRQQLLDQGHNYVFPDETKAVRDGDWQVAKVPQELNRRYIEITGPPTLKGTINALNSGADVFMADFEDALSPTFDNILLGQKALLLANERRLSVKQGDKEYKLNAQVATLIVRPRGLHLDEHNLIIDGQPISASIFDFGVYFYHNLKVRQLMGLGGVFYYLPKLESYKEARLWNDIFQTAESYMNVPLGTIRCTILIETIGGAIECEEILYELRNHIVALNAGRWDYLFSIIKKYKYRQSAIFPDRVQLTMTVPFMKAYTDRLVHVCHKRGAHAIGGMSAFIPSRTDKKVNEEAFQRVIADKTREVNDGFDGSWVAHPDLVKVAREVFVKHMGGMDNQKTNFRNDVKVTAEDLTNFEIKGGIITDQGVQTNISVTVQYLYNWLKGIGAVGINNLMEDAATAEISRGQLWQWIRFGCKTESKTLITKAYFLSELDKQVDILRHHLKDEFILQLAKELTGKLVLSDNFAEFLTLEAYQYLNRINVPKL